MTKSQTGEKGFEVHDVGKAVIGIQTLPGWRGLVKLQAPPPETSEVSCLAIRLSCRSIATRNYGLGVGTNGNSCLKLDFMDDSDLEQSGRRQLGALTQ